jgi:PTS system nitrogen regulatory IIA component
MQFSLPQVARLFSVSENTITRWVQQENLPVHMVQSQYRFDRAELLEWAAIHKQSVSPAIFREINGDRVGEISLADALERGGVAQRVPGGDRYETFRSAIANLPVEGLDKDNLLALLMSREKSSGTGVGNGIAIPHPRYPMVLPGNESVLRVCYLAHPLEFHAPDGKPVDTLFMLFCPSVHEHLQMLARLASLLQSADFRHLLASHPDKTRLVAAVRGAEHEHLAREGPNAE